MSKIAELVTIVATLLADVLQLNLQIWWLVLAYFDVLVQSALIPETTSTRTTKTAEFAGAKFAALECGLHTVLGFRRIETLGVIHQSINQSNHLRRGKFCIKAVPCRFAHAY